MSNKPFLKKIFGRKSTSDDDHDVPSRSALSLVETIVGFPFRLLSSGLRVLGVFHDAGVTTDADDKQSGIVVGSLKFLLWLPIRILQFPITLLDAIRLAPKTGLLFAIPVIAVLSILGFVVTQVFVSADEITNRYNRGLQTAVEANNPQLAKIYFDRLEATTELTPDTRFMWAKALASMGAMKEARVIVNNLAPDDKAGYGLAHQAKATSLSSELGQSRDPNILPLMKWHLNHSPSDSPATQQAWAAYHVATENPDLAVESLRKVADLNPSYYLAIASIYDRDMKKDQARLARGKAEIAFKSLLSEDRLRHPLRITLTNVLYQLEKYDEARELLKQGIRIQPDESLKRALSDFYLRRYRQLRTSDQPSDQQLEWLMEAIETTPNYQPIYTCLTQMVVSGTQSADSAKKIRSKFQEMLSEGKSQPFAHLALGDIHWSEGSKDKAKFHWEKAYELDSSLIVVVNNMAWILAHGPEPDLEKALEMSSLAILQRPGIGQFQDTHGRVLFKLKRYREAIKHLELALPLIRKDPEIHDLLATAYSEIGMDEIAAMHRSQAAAVGKQTQ